MPDKKKLPPWPSDLMPRMFNHCGIGPELNPEPLYSSWSDVLFYLIVCLF